MKKSEEIFVSTDLSEKKSQSAYLSAGAYIITVLAQRVMFYYFMCGERYRHFRGKKITLPVVLDSDLRRVQGSLVSVGNLERLRAISQNRAQWKELSKRVVGALSQQQWKRQKRKRKRKRRDSIQSGECLYPAAK